MLQSISVWKSILWKNPFNIPDPEFCWASWKISNPIPSRTAILDFLKPRKTFIFAKIADRIGIQNEEQLDGLNKRLSAMISDGSLFINRRGGYGVREKRI